MHCSGHQLDTLHLSDAAGAVFEDYTTGGFGHCPTLATLACFAAPQRAPQLQRVPLAPLKSADLTPPACAAAHRGQMCAAAQRSEVRSGTQRSEVRTGVLQVGVASMRARSVLQHRGAGGAHCRVWGEPCLAPLHSPPARANLMCSRAPTRPALC